MTFRASKLLLLLLAGCTLVNSKDGLAARDPVENDGDDTPGDGDVGSLDAGPDAAQMHSDGAGDGDGNATDGSPSTGDGDGDGDGGGVSGDGDGTVDPGDGEDDTGPTVIHDDAIEPRGIALRDGQVCWVGGVNPRGLYCIARDGSGNVETVNRPDDRAALDEAFDLSFDGSYVYWSNGENNQVIRRSLSGGTPEEYFTGAQGFTYLAQRGGTIFAITQHYANLSEQASIVFGPYSGIMSQIIYPNERFAAGVAVANNVVYWGAQNRDNGAWQFAFGPEQGNAEVIRVDTDGPVSGVAVDGSDTAYFIVGDQRIFKLRPGSNSPDLVHDAGSTFGQSDLTLDDTYLYWSEHDRGRIMRMRR